MSVYSVHDYTSAWMADFIHYDEYCVVHVCVCVCVCGVLLPLIINKLVFVYLDVLCWSMTTINMHHV